MWSSLGVRSPGLTWQAYPNDVINSELIKIIQTLGPDRSPNPALLAQYFPAADAIGRIYKIWPIAGPSRIIELPIPEKLREANQLVWIPMIKLGRFPHMGVESWQIELQVYY